MDILFFLILLLLPIKYFNLKSQMGFTLTFFDIFLFLLQLDSKRPDSFGDMGRLVLSIPILISSGVFIAESGSLPIFLVFLWMFLWMPFR